MCALALGSLHPAGTVQAQSLVDLYQAASSYDAAFQGAKAQYEANLARAEQAKAGLYPTVNLSANLSGTNSDIQKPAPAPGYNRGFGSQSAAISANQPLYRPANRATAAQGELQATQARSALITAEQDLIVRVSQAYFDVLASQDGLTFVKAQKAAVSEQLAAAKRNFEVGTSTITDSREAQARFDLVVAQEIAAENDLRVKQIALDQLVGKTGSVPKSLAVPVKLPDLLPADVNSWVIQAQNNHPSIKASELGVEIAKLETTKAQAGEKPTIDATASYGLNYGSGSVAGRLNSENRNATIGIALNYPLFTGYAVQNRIKETLQLEDKAKSDLEAAKRSIAQATRTAYFGVLSGQGQVKALEAAEASSQSALDANKLGYQVGVRINIDVLNSQSQLFQTKRDLAKARYDVLVGGLRLRQANGTLKADDLNAVNVLLIK
ncbi:MAG: TolC family outer membrane protein [Brachymonas sp.]|nr:TolC family outer membrane protein [Brachymonas sp.]